MGASQWGIRVSLLFLWIIIIIMLGVSASAKETVKANKKVLFGVDSTVSSNKAWTEKMCQALHRIVNQVGSFDSACVMINDFYSVNKDHIGLYEKEKKYEFFFKLTQFEDRFQLSVSDWAPVGRDFQTVEWSIHSTDEVVMLKKVEALIKNVIEFDQFRSEIKSIFLAGGLSSSKRLAVNPKGQIYDNQKKIEINDSDAVSIFLAENELHKHYLRAAIEIGIALGFGTIQYYAPNIFGGDERNPNQVDWLYWGWSGQLRRFKNLNGVRMDDNNFRTNLDHSLAGAVYYQLARSNNLSTLESFLYSFAASGVWEVIIEHREVISINDQVLTPVGGMVIGEALYQFGRYFRAKHSLIGQVLAGLFDSPTKLNEILDRKGNKRSLGDLSSPSGHFGFSAGQIHSDESGNLNQMGVGGEIYTIPMFDEPGVIRELYTDTAFSQILANFTGKGTAIQDFQGFAKVVMAAYYNKDLRREENGQYRGYKMFFGLSSAMEYESRGSRVDGAPADWVGSVHVVGTSLDITSYYKGVQLRVTMDVFGDFGMVRSYAIDKVKQQNGGKVPDAFDSVIRKNDYYYALGLTRMFSVEGKYNGIGVGYRFGHSDYDRIGSRNQYFETESVPGKTTDSFKKQEIFVSYDVTRKMKVIFSIEKREREGQLLGVKNSGNETIRGGKLVYLF